MVSHSQPHPSRQAVTWRLPRPLLESVRTTAAARDEPVIAFLTRALLRELDAVDTHCPHGYPLGDSCLLCSTPAR